MKKIFKYSLFTLTFCAIFLLPSCDKVEKYRDGISCEYLSKELCDEVDHFGEASSYSEEDVKLLLGDTSLFDDFSVIYSNEADDINEIGVFHCPDEKNSKELLTLAKGYISEQAKNQKAFVASYAPREVPKLEAAEARRYGNYVIYLILDENAKEEAFAEAKELLEE